MEFNGENLTGKILAYLTTHKHSDSADVVNTFTPAYDAMRVAEVLAFLERKGKIRRRFSGLRSWYEINKVICNG